MAIQSSTALPKGSGVVNTAVEKFLQQINVKRQAFHTQRFVGSHVDER